MLIIHPEKKNPDLEELLKKEAVKRIYPKETILCSPGDMLNSISYIAQGRIKCYAINQQGTEKTIHVYNSGWFMREGIFLMDTPFIANRFLETEATSVLYNIDSSCYERLKKYDVFQSAILLSCSSKVEFLRQEIESMMFDSGKDRLLKFLKSMSNTDDIKDSKWATVKMSYTQQQLAGIIGVNRVTISRFISELCRSGDIRVVNRKYQVRID